MEWGFSWLRKKNPVTVAFPHSFLRGCDSLGYQVPRLNINSQTALAIRIPRLPINSQTDYQSQVRAGQCGNETNMYEAVIDKE